MTDAEKLKLGQNILDIRLLVTQRLGIVKFTEYVNNKFKPMFWDICIDKDLTALELLIELLKKEKGNQGAFELVLACYSTTLDPDEPSLN